MGIQMNAKTILNPKIRKASVLVRETVIYSLFKIKTMIYYLNFDSHRPIYYYNILAFFLVLKLVLSLFR